nr:hypothetical protein [Tanacetum cinerariifolium]
MSTQQDIYAASSKNHPPMLNKDNYVPWLSRIIRYAGSRPNGKMIVDSIKNGPYIRQMIATPGEPDIPILVPESFHEQTDKELTENDIKRIDADDQAIQTILLGLPEDVYAAVDSFRQTKNLHEAEFTQIYDFLKMNQHKDRQTQNVRGNGGNQFGQYARQVAQNYNKNGLVVIPGIANQNGTGNVVAVRAKGIQLKAEEFDFMAAAGDLDEIEEVNINCILMANLQHASTSGTQLDKAPAHDTNGSAE